MSDAPEDLLDAVQALTRADERSLLQEITEAGEPIGHQRVKIKQPPLLEQLQTAIRSSMGGASTSGASLAFEGAVLNTAALFEAMKISSQIRDWCRIVKVVPTKDDLCTDLDAWYAATLARPMGDEVSAWHMTTLRSWAARIRGILYPPREREHPEDECPFCGSGDWYNPRDGLRYLHPLVTYYRPDDGDQMIDKAHSVCRACAKTWGARELAYDLEEKARNAESEDLPETA